MAAIPTGRRKNRTRGVLPRERHKPCGRDLEPYSTSVSPVGAATDRFGHRTLCPAGGGR